MNRNALKLIVAIVMLSLSSASVLAQTPATTSQKFNIRNALGQTITLTGPTSGVTPYTLTLPASGPGLLGQVLTTDLLGNLSWSSVGLGSVTSVGLTMPSIFSVSGTPVTVAGTLGVTLNSQSANTVFAAPDGSAGTPTFRTLMTNDIPDLSSLYIRNQTALQSSSNFHISGNGQIEGQLQLKGTSTGVSTIQAGAQGATNINYTLPVTAPASNGYVLTSTTGGSMSWTNPTSLPSSGWQITGNSGTTAGTNFLGTTDNVDFVLKTNNTERLRVDASGQLGLGTNAPDVMLDLNGGQAWRPGILDLTSGATYAGGANVRHDNVSIGDRTYFRISDTASFYSNRITGFTDGYSGKLLRIFNSTNTTMTLVVEDANSTAANRIVNPIGDHANVGLVDSGFADLVYDGTLSRWVIHSVSGPTSTTSNGFTYFTRRTSDIAVSATTATDVGMTINIYPDIVHTVDGMLYFTCAGSNTDVKIALQMTGGTATLSKITLLGHSDGGANVVDGSDIIPTNGTLSEAINVSAGDEMFVHVAGMFINGASNATLSLKIAKANGGGSTSDIVLKQGSYLRLIPVGVN